MSVKKHSLDFEKPLLELEKQLEELLVSSQDSDLDFSKEIKAIEKKIDTTKREIYADLTPWQKVQLSRHPNRPYSLDYIDRIFEGFQILHGDRLYKEDASIVGGLAKINEHSVMVLGQQKGRNTDENLKRNFGCPNPEGYRKALRLMRMANRFKMPIISFVDTPGAFPGIEAEERHIAEVIAVNLREMATFEVPIIVCVIGEGGSGGALGVAVADYVIVLENAYYSVISPEGCAAILWKDRSFASDASVALKLDADELLNFGVADEILQEPTCGAHADWSAMADNVKSSLIKAIERLNKVPDLNERRYSKFRSIGSVLED